MIITTPDIESDAASTNTLVTQQKCQETPRYLPSIVYSSLLISTLAFIFAIVNYVNYYQYNDVPTGIVPPVLAYIFTVPHHCAVILLQWLERHQTESIFPFAPASARAIVYSLASLSLWAASTTVSAINLHRDIAPWANCQPSTVAYANGTSVISFDCDIVVYYRTPAISYWCSLASMLASSLELILALFITLVCYMHYRRRNKAVQPTETTPSLTSTPSESKVLSA